MAASIVALMNTSTSPNQSGSGTKLGFSKISFSPETVLSSKAAHSHS